MFKRTFVLGCAAALSLSATACDTELTTANNNPNDPTDAPSSALFTTASRLTAARWLDGVGGTRYGFLPQHMAEVQYPESDAYLRLSASSTSGLFNGAYNSELQDLEVVMQRGKAANQPGVWGPAQVLSAYGFSVLTDVFGDVPYKEALDPAVLRPAYDPQKEIYDSIFVTLNAASDALSGAANLLGAGDPYYGGDPAAWRRLANSLRLRQAMRLTNVAGEATRVNAEVAAAIAASEGGLIDENSENALLVWPGNGIYDNPWAANFKTRDDHRISARLVTIMQGLNDPRIEVYAMPAGTVLPEDPARTKNWCPSFAGGDCYVGLVNALTHTTASPLLPNTSRPGEIFYPGATTYGTFGGSGGAFPSTLFTAAETYFLLAEAAQRSIGGLTPAQAANYYNLGIRRSMEFWGIPAATIDAYLLSAPVLYVPGNAGLRQIATQKWLALYTDPIQAWSEVRRTCQPANVEPGPNARAGFNIIPRRLQYSTTEAAVNRAEKEEAAQRQWGKITDSMLDRIYWDNAAGWAASPTYQAGCTDKSS